MGKCAKHTHMHTHQYYNNNGRNGLKSVHSFFRIKNSKSDFLKDFIYLFFEREEGREKERERNINVWLPLAHSPVGTWPTTQPCALDWESNL